MLKAAIKQRPSFEILSPRFEILRSGGCSSFSCVAKKKIGAGVDQSEKIEVDDDFVVWSDGDILYSGKVSEPTGTPESGYSVSGSNSTLYDFYVESGIVVPPLSERRAWNVIKSIIQNSGIPVSTFGALSTLLPTNKFISEISAGGMNIFDLMSAFALKTSTPIAWGVDGRNRFFAEIVSESSYGLTHRAVRDSLGYKYNTSSTVRHGSVRFVSGTTPKFPAVHANGAFAQLHSHPSEIQFNELNPFSDQLQVTGKIGAYSDSLGSGMAGNPKFTLNNGASIQTYGTQKVYELDHVNESITKSNLFSKFNFVNGKSYCLRYDILPESGTDINPATLVMKLTFNGPGTNITETTIVSGIQTQVRKIFSIPVGTTSVDVEFKFTAGVGGTDNGFGIKNIKLFRDDEPYPVGWEVVTPTSLVNMSINDYEVVEGSNFRLAVNANAGPAYPNANDWVAIKHIDADPVRENTAYRWHLAVKSVVGSTWPTFQIMVQFFDKDGTLISDTYHSPLIAIPAPTNFALVSNVFVTPKLAVYAMMYAKVLTRGEFVLGALLARDASEAIPGEIYGDTIEIVRAFGAGRQVRIDGDATTLKEAEDYITAWRASNAAVDGMSYIDRIERWCNYDILQMLCKPFRAIEINTKFPVESIAYDFSTGYATLVLSQKPRTLEDYIAKRVKTSSALS